MQSGSGSPKRQQCIGPGYNRPSFQQLHVSSCMCAPSIDRTEMSDEVLEINEEDEY